MPTIVVPGFLPSANGFRFPNQFPPVPVVRIPLGFRTIGIGRASDGLCGGMTFAAADLFAAKRLPPQDVNEAPGSGPLLHFLMRRAYKSLHIPAGPLRYALWSALPDGDALFGSIRGLVGRTLRRWPKIQAELDAGRPCPLGLIRVHAVDPRRLVLNHQVLAFGYTTDVNGLPVTVRVYDPNHPGEDTVAITVRSGGFDYVDGEAPVRAFFRTGYVPADPGEIFGSGS